MSLNENGLGEHITDAAFDSHPATATIVKYEKSSCLFCNEWFDAQSFTEHLIHCGQVLEECPNNCNVFLPRIRMRSHLKECSKSKLQHQRQSLNVDQRLCQQAERTMLEQDISTIRSVLNEEIRQRLHLITDVGNIRKHNQRIEDWTRVTEERLRDIQRQLEQETAQRNYISEQLLNDFQYNANNTQLREHEVDMKTNAMQKQISRLSDDVNAHHEQLNDIVNRLENVLFENKRLYQEKFDEIDDFLHQLNKDVTNKWLTNDDITKQSTLGLEVKSIKNIVCETEEHCEKLDSIVQSIDIKLHKTMQTLEDLENHMAMQQRFTSVQNIRGNLIWRIRDYSKKLEEAKQYDTILHSAMFSNKAFGYLLRLDIYLNGKGTWKGRNFIACLNVLPGEYDPLLPWPCRLQADVIIRNQSVNSAAAGQDFVKTIAVRKKSDELIHSNQYFHIPHKIISSGNYVLNDSIFVEVRVLK